MAEPRFRNRDEYERWKPDRQYFDRNEQVWCRFSPARGEGHRVSDIGRGRRSHLPIVYTAETLGSARSGNGRVI